MWSILNLNFDQPNLPRLSETWWVWEQKEHNTLGNERDSGGGGEWETSTLPLLKSAVILKEKKFCSPFFFF